MAGSPHRKPQEGAYARRLRVVVPIKHHGLGLRPRERVSAGRQRREEYCPGFTLIELLIAMTIVITLAALAIPAFMQALENARVARAVGDIRALQTEFAQHELFNGKLPDALADVGRGDLLDPWYNPYQYLNFSNTKGKGAMRKDRFLVPINSRYDLYSMGKDGQSKPPLTAPMSWDDIVRANDGAFVGLARQY